MSDNSHFGMVGAWLRDARAAHQAGDISRAEPLYLKILKEAPDHAEAQHNLGIIRAQQGRFEEALLLFNQVLTKSPGAAQAHLNVGNVLCGLRRYQEALASYDRALAITPANPQILGNRGNVFVDLKRYPEALEDFERAMDIRPNDAGFLNNRANALLELRRPEEALIDIDKAIAINPNFVEAWNNRGNVLKELKRDEEAISNYDQAIKINPRYFKALNNRGLLFFQNGQYEQAVASYDAALVLAPAYPDALNNRGNALLFLGRNSEATLSYERALEAQPDHPWAPNGLADAVLKTCDWSRAEKIIEGLPAHIMESKSVINPFTLLGYSGDPMLQLKCAQAFYRNRIPSSPEVLSGGSCRPRDRIRVAYLSADFRIHPVASLIVELFELHDRARFEIVGISFGPDDQSGMRERIKTTMDQFHDVRSKSDLKAAMLIKSLDVDIAVDLTGYTLDARPGILSYRPAPVQVSYLGFPATTGGPDIDYIIADRTVLPFEEQSFYTEQIVHLPNCYMPNDSKRKISSRSISRNEAGLPEGGFVFCCFSATYKITKPVFDVWMRILRTAEGSVLWLAHANEVAADNLRRDAVERGIDAGRLVFAPRVASSEKHLARHRLADLFLDTLPFNAHTTAMDALWAGLPLLTCSGTSFSGRVASSLLNAIGLSDLATKNLGDYEAMAVRLARSSALLGGYRNLLQKNRNVLALFNTDRFRRDIETAYTMMHARSIRGESPGSFAI